MDSIKSAKFLLPGFFLFVLGLGNVTVGTLKHRQYNKVVEELADLQPTATEVLSGSPLQRIQRAKITEDRHDERMGKALARAQFYGLVIFGGKVFLSLSIGFLLVGSLVAFNNARNLSLKAN